MMKLEKGYLLIDKNESVETVASIDENFVVLRTTFYRDNGERMISTYRSISKIKLLEKINNQEVRIYEAKL